MELLDHQQFLEKFEITRVQPAQKKFITNKLISTWHKHWNVFRFGISLWFSRKNAIPKANTTTFLFIKSWGGFWRVACWKHEKTFSDQLGSFSCLPFGLYGIMATNSHVHTLENFKSMVQSDQQPAVVFGQSFCGSSSTISYVP